MSGRQFSFELHRTSAAAPEAVFALISDAESWARWGKPVLLRSGWAVRGTEPGTEVGSVRAIGVPPLVVRERILEEEPGRRHRYELIGPPLTQDYVGEATLTPTASGGTDLHWTVSFTERWPGSGVALAPVLKRTVTFIADRVVRAAER